MADHQVRKPRLLNRLFYSKSDPLRYLHVPKRQRLDEDPPIPTTDYSADLEWIRDHPDDSPEAFDG